MRAFTATLALLCATAASAAPASKPGCAVTQPILYTLDDEFTLITHAPDTPSLHQKTITISDTKAVLSPTGDIYNLTLTDSVLGVDYPEGPDSTAFLQVPRHTTWRQVAFNAEDDGRLKVQASYSCLEDDRAVTEVTPYQEDGGLLAWCIQEGGNGEEKGLAVEERDEANDCTEVRLIVTDGIRPL